MRRARCGWDGDATTWVWLMRRIRNLGGSKRGGEIRHPAGGRIPARSGLRNDYYANH